MTRKMSSKEAFKYLDLLIKNIEDTDLFSIHNILKKSQNLSKKNADEFSKLITDVKSIGKKEGLFSSLTKDNDYFELTERGKKLKGSYKSFQRFQKSENKSDYWLDKNRVLSLLTALSLAFTIFMYFDNRALERKYELLVKKQDALKSQLKIYKDSVSNLKIRLMDKE